MMGMAGAQVPDPRGCARRAVPRPRRYMLTDRLTGEDYAVNAPTIERLTGIEIAWIDWAIAEDGLFENGKWRVR